MACVLKVSPKQKKKSGRVAAEGLVGILSDGNKAAMSSEVNSETDFVARNEQFQRNRARCCGISDWIAMVLLKLWHLRAEISCRMVLILEKECL